MLDVTVIVNHAVQPSGTTLVNLKTISASSRVGSYPVLRKI
jgi:hypothetical protein